MKNQWNWWKSMKSMEIDENRCKSMKANFDGRTPKAILSILTILNIVNFASNSLYRYGIPGLGFGLATPPHTKPWIGQIDENRWNRCKSMIQSMNIDENDANQYKINENWWWNRCKSMQNRWNRWKSKKSMKIDRWTSMKSMQIDIKSMKIDDEIDANR